MRHSICTNGSLSNLQGEPLEHTDRFQPHLLFYPGEPGKLAGSAGCNQLAGTFTLDADRAIHIEAAITTRMACHQPEIEYEIVRSLEECSIWSVAGKELVLSGNKGTLLKLTAVKPSGE